MNDKNNTEFKDMTGYIAKNDKKTKDSQPSWRGKIRIEGKEYLLSLWEKDGDIMNISAITPEELSKKMESFKKKNNYNNSSQPSSQSSNNSKTSQPYKNYNEAAPKFENKSSTSSDTDNTNDTDLNDEDPFGDLFDSLPGD